MPDFFDDGRVHDGLTYDEYRSIWREQKEAAPTPGMSKDDRKRLHYLKYNWDRQQVVHDAYDPSDDLRDAVHAIEAPQVWMVLTEPWCGDSAYNLPVLAEAAALSDTVTLRILLRDDNLDVMDQYLTGSSRSIPKLVAFSEDGKELFTWGPRAEEASSLFAKLRAKEMEKEEMIQHLLQHYEEGAWREVDDELAALLRDEVATNA